MIQTLQATIREAIQHHGFKRLLLAVSGGLDSICLAHFFVSNKEALGIEWLGIAHVHHGLREGTADRDAEFVRNFAEKNGIPFFLKKLDGEALKASEGSLEENARDARYNALLLFASENQAEAIVTAHHAGDQAETMYLRLRRGVTLAGLHGIQQIRLLGDRTLARLAVDERLGLDERTLALLAVDERLSLDDRTLALLAVDERRKNILKQDAENILNQDDNGQWLVSSLQDFQKQEANTSNNLSSPLRGSCALSDKSPSAVRSRLSSNFANLSSLVTRLSSKIYRPFLSVTREELRGYAAENHLTWCEDESNSDTQFTRNKIRHQLLPNLEQLQPGATEQLSRIAKLADVAYSKILTKAETLFAPTIIQPKDWPFEAEISPYKNVLALDATALQDVFDKRLKKDATDSQKQGLGELFRLWLDSRGFRFPTDTFTIQQTLPTFNTHYRTRFIEKCRHIVWIYDTSTTISPANLYFENEIFRFSQTEGEWRSPQKSDTLKPLDEKIKARPLSQWLQEKSVPHWIRPLLKVFAQGDRVLYVAGIRQKIKNA